MEVTYLIVQYHPHEARDGCSNLLLLEVIKSNYAGFWNENISK